MVCRSTPGTSSGSIVRWEIFKLIADLRRNVAGLRNFAGIDTQIIGHASFRESNSKVSAGGNLFPDLSRPGHEPFMDVIPAEPERRPGVKGRPRGCADGHSRATSFPRIRDPFVEPRGPRPGRSFHVEIT